MSETDELRAALASASSPSWSQRARAGRDLAPFADVPLIAEKLMGLLLDAADTAVTRQTAEALARVGTVAAVRLIALAVVEADDNHADWMQTAITDALAEPESVPAIATICEQLARDPAPPVRRGSAMVLAWAQDARR